MGTHIMISDDELPELTAIILPRNKTEKPTSQPLRRSPRKNPSRAVEQDQTQKFTDVSLSATSSQRPRNLKKASPSKRSQQTTIPQESFTHSLFDNAPVLSRKAPIFNPSTHVGSLQASNRAQTSLKPVEADSLLASFSKLELSKDDSDADEVRQQKSQPSNKRGIPTRSRMSKNTSTSLGSNSRTRDKRAGIQRASQYVLDEARCDEDLADSDAQDEGEENDTDLSGFIVDDDVEISYHESSDAVDSEEERRTRRKAQKEKPRRRLQRGRRKIEESEDEITNQRHISRSLTNLNTDESDGEHIRNGEAEVIDLVSPEPNTSTGNSQVSINSSASIVVNLFDKFKALKLSPPRSSQILDIPSKAQPTMSTSSINDFAQPEDEGRNSLKTPPATPPRSPSKLKSPSKLLSPSKRGDAVPRSPHRQSMDAFWDLNEVNEWNDQYSPKKEPTASPRKNRLASFDPWSDAEEDSFDAINDTSDSLPSPCESPSKSKTGPTSPVKAEKQRFLAEKKAKQAEKRRFEDTRDQMAMDLLSALDKHVTDSRISKLSASTGGVQVIWSKTLRSTAGRANWRRTVTKPTGSPVKARSEESAPGTIVQHFANIELAVKVIDREDRLINTLAHEFCHLANFMVSGIRDQPHGTSFQTWAKKVTTWMKTQDLVEAWKGVEVTTKHGYVIEWKYLWVCVGRDKNRAMEVLGINGEEGCGAEYGRHSKSIDVEVQRCGKCKGRLVQVRPRPRASPVKKTASVEKKGVGSARERRFGGKGVGFVERLVEVIELSD